MSEPTFRIVAPTHRRPGDLQTFLEALVPQIRQRSNVVLTVVNDASHSPAYESVLAPYRAHVDYRICAENGGPGAARQAGTEGAQEDYVVMTDDDCVAPPHWIAQMIALAELNPTADVIAGSVYFIDTDNPSIVERYYRAARIEFGVRTSQYGLMVVPTPCLMIRRDALENAGGFAPEFRIGEDAMITHALLQSGASFLIDNSWLIGHKAEQSLRSDAKRWFGYGTSCARYCIHTQDWRWVPLFVDDRLKTRIWFLRRSLRTVWSDPKFEERPVREKIEITLMDLIREGAFQIGFLKGLRQYTRHYGRGLPAVPELRERLSDFVFGETTT